MLILTLTGLIITIFAIRKIHSVFLTRKINNYSCLDKLPIIVWINDKDFKPIYQNQQCKKIIGQSTMQSINRELLKTNEKVQKIKIRDLYEKINFQKTQEGGITLISGTFISKNAGQDAFNSSISTLLNLSGIAIAGYNSERRLITHNNAFETIWELEKQWLDSKPKYENFLDKLIEKRQIPEKTDFGIFKKKQLKLFYELSEVFNTKWTLPDSRTIKILAIPDANGGIVFSYEDITKQLQFARTCDMEIGIYKEILDNIDIGISIFGENGKLRLHNKNYEKIWKISKNLLNNRMSIADIMSHTKHMFLGNQWETAKNKIYMQLNERVATIFRIKLTNEKTIDIKSHPLQNGNIMLLYSDATDDTVIERALQERSKAINSAEKLKSEFLANTTCTLHSPLTSIIGYAEILQKQIIEGGPIKKYLEILEIIIGESLKLKNQVDNIVYLSTLDTGRIKINLSQCPIIDLIKDAAKSIEKQIKNKKIDIVLNTKNREALNIKINCDPKIIKQIILQVFNISLEDKKCQITIDLSKSENNLEINFQHISEESNAIIGLLNNMEFGILLAKKLAKLHGGSVEIKNKQSLYKGAKIILPLPKTNV